MIDLDAERRTAMTLKEMQLAEVQKAKKYMENRDNYMKRKIDKSGVQRERQQQIFDMIENTAQLASQL